MDYKFHFYAESREKEKTIKHFILECLLTDGGMVHIMVWHRTALVKRNEKLITAHRSGWVKHNCIYSSAYFPHIARIFGVPIQRISMEKNKWKKKCSNWQENEVCESALQSLAAMRWKIETEKVFNSFVMFELFYRKCFFSFTSVTLFRLALFLRSFWCCFFSKCEDQHWYWCCWR